MRKKLIYMSAVILFVLCVSVTVYLGFFRNGDVSSGCMASNCHSGIEYPSENHKIACEECHGGDPLSADKAVAHAKMLGGRNPGDPAVWDKTCGKCHQYQLERVSGTLMYTATGMIKNSQQAWDDYEGKLYSTGGAEGFDENGKPQKRPSVAELDELSGELYRKFCSACHVGYDKLEGYRAHHSSGCSACHFNHSDEGTYAGGDKTIHGKGPYPEKHVISALPSNDVCLTCHNRSGRLALSYEGYYDGNNSLVPTKDGYPGPDLVDGVRNVRHMEADIHFGFGMDCIDCHTSRDMMGDGYMYENMYQQIETACEDCHGTEKALPKTMRISKENSTPVRESQNYKVRMSYGDEMVLTSKGRMYSNVRKENGKFYLYTKREGKRLEIKTVKGTQDHGVSGHGRMECYTCHSNTVAQCYGCHTTYDKTEKMTDLIKGQDTPGAFSETEDFRTLFPFPLGLNQRGKISPVTPGCQTFLTYIDEKGNKVLDDHVFNYRGEKKFKFAPFFSHNTGKKAVSCETCHSKLAFAGFGQGLVSVTKGNIGSSYMCDKCEKPLDSLYSIKDGKINVTSDVVRDHSRLLNTGELAAMLRANTCIMCHEKGEGRIYGGRISYDAVLSDPVHKPLLH
ncbi:selenite/tellurite reduction operon c-type cytochrome ExtM [Seleniivibrio woodruffii]|uniref:selenite/tellurite reduction operon c-type cytochrome ExtM n=1 Tax=Seleniivibrio woodruffii TaxID=1078050 RepID=UPI00240A55BA|nr:selenite/tellurite reduction operon c-type cytochrome ExtM [Seleniivibrio woodruffii]